MVVYIVNFYYLSHIKHSLVFPSSLVVYQTIMVFIMGKCVTTMIILISEVKIIVYIIIIHDIHIIVIVYMYIYSIFGNCQLHGPPYTELYS